MDVQNPVTSSEYGKSKDHPVQRLDSVNAGARVQALARTSREHSLLCQAEVGTQVFCHPPSH